MKLFSGGSSPITAKWTLTQNSPGNPPSNATLVFTFDPSQVPQGMIGGTGTQTSSGPGGSTDSFVWAFGDNMLTWQLTNQSSKTPTTFWGAFNGVNTVNGGFCNYETTFTVGTVTAVYQGS